MAPPERTNSRVIGPWLNASASRSNADCVLGSPNAARTEAWGGSPAAVGGADGTMSNTFPLVAPPLGSTLIAYHVVSGRWLRAGDRSALVVNQRLVADEPGMELGREITLIIGGRKGRWTIVGIVDAGPSPAAVPLVWVPAMSGVLQWLAVVVGVSLVACAWPAFRAMRVPTAAALAYE